MPVAIHALLWYLPMVSRKDATLADSPSLSRSKGRLSATQSGSPGPRHCPTLCTFPRQSTSVVSADFDPHTVAGQRWIHTIFPGHDLRSDHHPADGIYNRGYARHFCFMDSSIRQAGRPLSLPSHKASRIMASIKVKMITCTPWSPREAGASPALPRNCERGRNLHKATGRTAGKGQGVGRSVSQET